MSKKETKPRVKGEDDDSGLDITSDSNQSGDEEGGTSTKYFDPSLRDYDPSINDYSKELKDYLKQQSLEEENNQISDDTEPPITSQNDVQYVRIELINSEEVDEEYREAVDFFKTLTTGQNESINFSVRDFAKKPQWLDEEKFKRGQKFARDYFFCINFAEMVSLYILFAQKSSLGPLIFTGKSDSPFNAFCRYLGTVTKLMSWYRDDLWGEGDNDGKNNINTVRTMHKHVYQKLTKTPENELTKKITLGNPNTTALWCPLKDLLVRDFQESIPQTRDEVQHFLDRRKVWINQADMSITQFGFVGLAVTYPSYFGIHLASVEDLDDFLHMWRGLGYLLGIKDEYNYCNGNLETVRLRTKFFLEVVAKPALRDVTCDWEHMCRCLTSGIAFYIPHLSFESSLFYLCQVLEIQTPRLSKNLTFGNYITYQFHRLVFYLMKNPNVLAWLNGRLKETIKKAQNASPEVLNKWQSRQFAYMNQEGKCPIQEQRTSTNV